MTEETEKPSSIRQWLARYKPTMVRCTLATNEVRELQTPKQGRGQWQHLERAITMLAPAFIEAFQGKTCVATRPMEVESDDAPDAPTLPNVERKHPFAAMITTMPTLVQLNVDAADAACERQEGAYKLAFEALLETNRQFAQLVQIVSNRLGGLERAWHQMFLDRARTVGSDDENDGLASTVLQSIFHRNGAAPPNGAPPNGGKPE